MKLLNPLLESIIVEFENEINEVVIDNKKPLQDIEGGMKVCVRYIKLLREFIGQGILDDIKKEIYFFKIIKPKFVGQLLYYYYLQQIESKRPMGKDSLVLAFLHDNLVVFNQYLKEQHIGYLYYTRGASHHDKQYFFRKNFHPGDYVYHPYAIMDSEFSTRYDHIFAEFKAHELVIGYLTEEINKLEVISKNMEIPITENMVDTRFKWTGSRTAFTELVYALADSGVINNGEVNIRRFSDKLCVFFNLETFDVYRSFMDIKNRKSYTSFIDKMKNSLLKRIDTSYGKDI